MVAWLNRTLGGLGIAVFRLLYLRAQTFVLGCGERTLLWTIAATNAVIIVRHARTRARARTTTHLPRASACAFLFGVFFSFPVFWE